MVVVWASPEQPVRIRKLSAYLDIFERTTLLLVRKSHGLEEHPVYYKPLVHLRVSSRNNVLSSQITTSYVKPSYGIYRIFSIGNSPCEYRIILEVTCSHKPQGQDFFSVFGGPMGTCPNPPAPLQTAGESRPR